MFQTTNQYIMSGKQGESHWGSSIKYSMKRMVFKQTVNTCQHDLWHNMGMDQYLLIPFLGE